MPGEPSGRYREERPWSSETKEMERCSPRKWGKQVVLLGVGRERGIPRCNDLTLHLGSDSSPAWARKPNDQGTLDKDKQVRSKLAGISKWDELTGRDWEPSLDKVVRARLLGSNV